MNFQNTGYTIKQVQQQIHIAMEDALRPLSLNISQYNVLKNLEALSPTTGAELARKAFVTPQTMHTILMNMEKKGFIKRSILSGNSKSFAVFTTTTGGYALKDAEKALSTVFNNGDTALTSKEHSELEYLLQKLSTSL